MLVAERDTSLRNSPPLLHLLYPQYKLFYNFQNRIVASGKYFQLSSSFQDYGIIGITLAEPVQSLNEFPLSFFVICYPEDAHARDDQNGEGGSQPILRNEEMAQMGNDTHHDGHEE